MNPDRAIATLGFRRWYGRQRLAGLAGLVGCFLCMILLAVGVQGALAGGDRAQYPTGLLIALAAAAGGVWSWHCCRVAFARAGRYGSVAHCEHCGSYARFEVEAAAGDAAARAGLRVRCRQCGHRWAMTGA